MGGFNVRTLICRASQRTHVPHPNRKETCGSNQITYPKYCEVVVATASLTLNFKKDQTSGTHMHRPPVITQPHGLALHTYPDADFEAEQLYNTLRLCRGPSDCAKACAVHTIHCWHVLHGPRVEISGRRIGCTTSKRFCSV